MLRVIEQWGELREPIGVAASRARGGLDPTKAKLLAPIPTPRRNVFCVGWNYSEHFQEGANLRAAQVLEQRHGSPSFLGGVTYLLDGGGVRIVCAV